MISQNQSPKSPKGRNELEIRIGIPPKAFVPDANLDAALERLKQGVFGKAGAERRGRGQ
jgi:hypothetical protein